MTSIKTSILLTAGLLVASNFSAYATDDPVFGVNLTNDTSQIIAGEQDETFSFRTQAILTYDQNYSDYFSAHVSVAGLYGDNGSANVGDIQAYSNIDTDEFTGLYEAWLRMSLTKSTFIKLGQIDANADFAFPINGGNFINSSYGYSPTIGYLGSYPEPNFGIVTSIYLGNDQRIKIGGFAGNDNEYDKPFFIAEVSQAFSAFQFKFGAWFQNEEVRVFANEPQDIFNPSGQPEREVFRNGDDGFYLVLDGHFRNANWFFQYGYADSDTQTISDHIGAGVAFENVLYDEQDEFGVGLTYAKVSEDYNESLEQSQNQTLPSAELAFEVYYQYRLNKYLMFKPNLQFIKDPASQPGIDDALVFTLRTQINF